MVAGVAVGVYAVALLIGPFRDAARRTFEYRRQVLAVFDELVGQARVRARVQ